MKTIIAIVAAILGINLMGAQMNETLFNQAVDKAVDFITAREGFKPYWYDDATGRAIPNKYSACKGTATIGHGLTGVYWESNSITLEQSKAIVRTIIVSDAKLLLKGLKRTPTVNNLAALCSLAYRRGVRAILRSNTFKKINEGDWSGVVREWKDFNTSGGVVMAGLTKRCNEEIKLFFMA